ncbi:MAG: hypothetical protein KatS3mg068_1541 [Candidatus Sericytochromatia bacterium]|nr:MAG: hypothetical protein KatS3mg068_1541 [Candidatus Sericytochromatia bacterium]
MLFDLKIKGNPVIKNDLLGTRYKSFKNKYERLIFEQFVIDDFLLIGDLQEVCKKYNITEKSLMRILYKYGIDLRSYNLPTPSSHSFNVLYTYLFLQNFPELSLKEISKIIGVSEKVILAIVKALKEKGFLRNEYFKSIERKKQTIKYKKIDYINSRIKILNYKGLEIPVFSKTEFLKIVGLSQSYYSHLLKDGTLKGGFIEIDGKYYYTIYELILYLYVIWNYAPLSRRLKLRNQKVKNLVEKGYNYIKSCIEQGKYPLEIPIISYFKNISDLRNKLSYILKSYNIVNNNLLFDLENLILTNTLLQKKS